MHEYRRLARALTGAPVCGVRKLPEGRHRDTGGDTGGGLHDEGGMAAIPEGRGCYGSDTGGGGHGDHTNGKEEPEEAVQDVLRERVHLRKGPWP